MQLSLCTVTQRGRHSSIVHTVLALGCLQARGFLDTEESVVTFPAKVNDFKVGIIAFAFYRSGYFISVAQILYKILKYPFSLN